MTTDFDKIIRAVLLEAFNGELTVLGTHTEKTILKIMDNKSSLAHSSGHYFPIIIATVWFENEQLNLAPGDSASFLALPWSYVHSHKIFLSDPNAIEQFIEAVKKIRSRKE